MSMGSLVKGGGGAFQMEAMTCEGILCLGGRGVNRNSLWLELRVEERG